MVMASTPSSNSSSSSAKARHPTSAVARARCSGSGSTIADQRHPGQTGQHPGMVAAHHACADHADTQAADGIGLRVRCGPFGTHDLSTPKQTLSRFCAGNFPGGSLARRHRRGERDRPFLDTF
jgi:hypothetical protein